ncbi:pyridoxamine 5'-phosphate oxidase family protein [Aquisalinus flavus]|uniref:General stress protein n=1 Tax=Aquisalinus flavus TaxID=1526572 RepID=A0A8J2V5M2_9PROT|nr:pyridoxamine 5'-phosphate oxidase family protein [Aquisalinus flavus]MBD0426713.1 pyridoxamine 5'-phosphate oxidase family protein [Aquisalinus flavus]UNE46578.1 general stress protein [Aquisalinus flavus]GGC95373.1 general stress protein [Aquisalinus flavus]
MTDTEMTRKHPEKQFWDELEDVHAVMLGLLCNRDHMQPMAPFADPENGKVWFFSRKSNDLVTECGAECTAHFTFVADHNNYYASAKGRLRRSGNVDKVEEYWSPVVAAWYEHGKDDPDIALMELTLEDAAMWSTTGNALKFGWEIAKANIRDEKQPDLGERNRVVFTRAA